MPVGPILVVGKSGQLARCLVDSAAANGVGIEAVGRSQLDLEMQGRFNGSYAHATVCDYQCRCLHIRRNG